MNEYNLEYIQTKTGVETLKINDYLIHSKYNPKREAKLIVDKNYSPHYVHIVFGYGCGYIVEELVERRSFNEIIIVIDPLFNNGIKSNLHKAENLFYNTTEVIDILEIYTNTIAKNARVNFKSISTPNYDNIFPEIYKNLLLKIREIQYKNRTNDFTIIRYAKEWQRNFIRNLFNIDNNTNIESLKGVYDCPVVVASGGPSLTKQIPLLKKIKDSIILIAAGSTINSLLSNGVEPDYVVSIDGGEPNYHHFKEVRVENAQLIFSMQHHYKVNDSFRNKGYIFGTQGFENFNKFLKLEFNLDLPILEYGGSVAHSSFNIAQYISNGPIALIGQDLAYTNDLTHASNNKHSRKIDENFIKKQEAFLAEGYYGDSVWTTPVFNSMRMDFESIIIAKPPNVPFYNCTEGGIKINGFNQIPFQNFVDKYVDTREKVTICESNNTEKSIQTIEVVNRILGQLVDLKKILINGLELLDKNQSNTHFDKKVSKQLALIDQKIKEILAKLPIEPMTLAISIAILQNFLPKENETLEETYSRVVLQTRELYTQLIGAVEFVDKCIVEIFSENESGDLL